MLGASLVPGERDHILFITWRHPVQVVNASARSGWWLSKSRSEPDNSLSIYGNEPTQNWPCKRSSWVGTSADLNPPDFIFEITVKTISTFTCQVTVHKHETASYDVIIWFGLHVWKPFKCESQIKKLRRPNRDK